MPASSVISAICRQFAEAASLRSGATVAVRADEQLAPNRPILSALPLCIDSRACRGSVRFTLSIASLFVGQVGRFDHLAPLLDFAAIERVELVRRAGQRIEALRRERGFH